MMKVKAKENYDFGITKNKTYTTVGICCSGYNVFNDGGIPVFLNKNLCEPVPEKPQIEVGSEWERRGLKGGVATVKYVGDHKVFIKWLDGSEGERAINGFHDNFKQKPKTVTMYFYKLPHGYVAYSNEHPFDTIAFKKEIEL